MKSKAYSLLAFILIGLSIYIYSSKSKLQEKFFPQYVAAACSPISQFPTGDFVADSNQAIFNNEPVENTLEEPLLAENNKAVLGETSAEKWIDIDLSDQTITAKEGDKTVQKYKISSGKWAPTPKGKFRIYSKLKYSTMSGGDKSKNTYYYLPNVPYVMFFNGAYGIHGTYWHNNFGVPMSHGCVNMSITDAGRLFDWAHPIVPEGALSVSATSSNPGTKVIVHE